MLGRQQQVTYLAVVHSPFCLYVSPFTTGIRGIFTLKINNSLTQISSPDRFFLNTDIFEETSMYSLFEKAQFLAKFIAIPSSIKEEFFCTCSRSICYTVTKTLVMLGVW